MLNSLNQRDNMRAAIGFWTWLGREEGTLQTNEVNSHTPSNRREQVNPNPRPNRIAPFPPPSRKMKLNWTVIQISLGLIPIPGIKPPIPLPPVWKRAITKVEHPSRDDWTQPEHGGSTGRSSTPTAYAQTDTVPR